MNRKVLPLFKTSWPASLQRVGAAVPRRRARVEVARREAAILEAAVLVVSLGAPGMLRAQDPLNVLFIVSDDLRPELGIYDTRARTPNIDALAASGLTFDRAYCNFALCNPSRASVLTGLRPDTIRVWDNSTHFRKTVPDVLTLPQHFKNHGYFAEGVGKVFSQDVDDSPSWNPGHRVERVNFGGCPLWGPTEGDGNEQPDAVTAARVVELLGEVHASGRPFFLAAGFIRPHLSLRAPQKYFDMYPLADIALPENRSAPAAVPVLALHDSRRITNCGNDFPVSDQVAKEVIQAYLATVSFVDEQVGRLLDELERLELRERTVVIFWGDHGWHLGEQSLWGKRTNFEIAARVPVIISAPGQASGGMRTDALVELVDVYPTITELATLPLPGGLEGRSLAPLLEEPARPWKTAAFHQMIRPGFTRDVTTPETMGYAMRTARYRYTEWLDWSTKEVLARELYDFDVDPGETVNIAELPENETFLTDLSAQLAAGWEAAVGPIPAPPTADFVISAEVVNELEEISVDGARSMAEVGHEIDSYQWYFGDGTTPEMFAEPRKAFHTYKEPGRFNVRLIVEDDRGLRAEASRSVLVHVQPVDVTPWTSADIGEVSSPGASRPDSVENCLVVEAAGGNITGTTDEFHFVSQEVTGDFSLVVEITGWNVSVDSFSKAGLMVRDSLESGARHASVFVEKFQASFRHRFLERVEVDGATSSRTDATYESPRLWLRIERQNQRILASLSLDNKTWSEPDRSALEGLPDKVHVGFAASSPTDGRVVRACSLRFESSTSFIRGDCDQDGNACSGVNDALELLSWLFLGSAEPPCLTACDPDGNGELELADAVYGLNFCFAGTDAPVAPFPECGAGTDADEALGCADSGCQ